MYTKSFLKGLALSLIVSVAAFGQEIDIPLVITDGAGGERELRFGLDPTATDGIDEHLGEMALPPLPPGGVFEARFIGADIGIPELGLGSYRDYRSGDEDFVGDVIHELQYQVGTGTVITIDWNLPEDVTGRLQDIITGTIIDVPMAGTGSYTVDNPGAISKLQMTVSYAAPNQPPAFTSVPVIEAFAFAEYAYHVVAIDPDDDPLTLSAGALPGWLSFVDHGDGTGLLSGTPGNDDAGNVEITLTASDGELSTDQVFTLTVHFVNQPPAFVSTPVTNATAFQAYSYSVQASDPDGDALTLSAGTLPGWLSFVDNGNGTGVLSGTPTNDDAGDVEITLTASDGELSTDQVFTLTVHFVNQPPAFVSAPVTNATAFQAYAYDVEASDPDDDPLTLSAGALPGWLSFVDHGDGTGLLSGTPGNDDAGDVEITLTASDGELSTDQVFTLTVHEVNEPPVFVSEPVTNATAFEAYLYAVEATDPNGDALTLTSGALPAWLSFVDSGNGTGVLSGTPTNDDAGDVEITLTASDGELSTDQVFTLTVHFVNQPPAFVSDPVTEAFVGEDYVYEVVATDPDGDALTLSAGTLPAWLSFVDNGGGSGLLSGTPAIDDAGDVEVTLTASDGALSTDQAFTLVVHGINEAPVFVSDPPTDATAFQAYEYVVEAMDPDGDSVSLSAGTLPGWLSFVDNGDGTGLLSGTPDNDDAGDVEVTLTASDGELSTDQVFTLTVHAVNQPPVFVSDPVTEATAFEAYVYEVAASDPDGDAITLSGTVLPAWLSFVDNGDGTGYLSGTPAGGDAGHHDVTLVASDGELTAEQTFQIHVTLVLGMPDLTTPVDGAAAVSRRPHLHWEDVEHADAFDIEITPIGDPRSSISYSSVAGTSFLVPEMLDPVQEFEWTVRARLGDATGSYAEAISFTTTEAPTYSGTAVVGGDPLAFPEAGIEIHFTDLDGDGEAVVTRHTHAPEPAPDDLFLIGNTFWTIDFDGPEGFTADVCFALADLGETGALDNLRVLRRDHGAADWVQLDVWFDPENEPEWACIATMQFSDFSIASTKPISTESGGGLPAVLALVGNYPNPFSTQTTLVYDMPEPAPVQLVVYDMLGRRVAVLLDGEVAAGRHEVAFDSSGLGAGVYIVRIVSGGDSQSRRVVLMK